MDEVSSEDYGKPDGTVRPRRALDWTLVSARFSTMNRTTVFVGVKQMAEGSFLTSEEVEELQSSELSKEKPFMIRGVSNSQFSVARHYGAVNYNGSLFTYVPDTDELIRDDVLAHIMKNRNAAEKIDRAARVEKMKAIIDSHPKLF